MIRTKLFPTLLLTVLLCGVLPLCAQQAPISLNGRWETGNDRRYTAAADVPGIDADPTKKNDGKRWYRREVTLPRGSWSAATLELCGARFRPEVYVNGVCVSRAEGGMAPTFHPLKAPGVLPGRKIVLEIALASLADLPPEDASYIPVADQWRSNNSSGLWDDVNLHFHYAAKIDGIVLFPTSRRKNCAWITASTHSPGKSSARAEAH